MNNFNFYNGFNLWSPIQPASFTDSLSYLQHIEILREKINEVVENLNNANFYSRGLKPGKAIDIVGATKGSGFFNGEDPTIINTVINNSVLTDNKPGWHRIFTTKVITEDLKSGLTFLFQEQPLNHNCENDKLSWGILKINFVYNPTDADVDYNTYNIKIVDFAFEEERNLTDKLDRFMLVRRINPCNAENVMELYYKVPTKEEATECADACGPAALFTLLGIDNNTINFNTFIKLENDGLNTTTYDGINGVKTNPVINFDYDDITLIGDTEGYGLMNTRNVKVEPTTTPQLIDSFDTTGDVDMTKVNVLKNHRPYDNEPKTNDIVFNMEVPKLIDKISVENSGVVEGNGSVVVPEVLGAENNIAITIENTFNEDAIKDKVEQYAPKTDVIPPDGSMVLYLAPVDGDDTMDGLTVDTAMKSMTALLNKNYAKEIEVHLVGEPPVAEGEGVITVNGANYSSIKIVDENSILAGYSLEVNNSNVIITNVSPAAGAGSLSLRNDEIEDIEEVLVEEDTVIDFDPNTQRVHYNTYTFKPTMYALKDNETDEDIEEITETYYSIMPLQLTQNTIYSLEGNNSIIDIQGTFTDIHNCSLENTTLNNSVSNLNYHTNSFNNVVFNFDNKSLPTILNGEAVSSTFNFNQIHSSGGSTQYYMTTDSIIFRDCNFKHIGFNLLNKVLIYSSIGNSCYFKFTGGTSGTQRLNHYIYESMMSILNPSLFTLSTNKLNCQYSTLIFNTSSEILYNIKNNCYMLHSSNLILPTYSHSLTGNNQNTYASKDYPGYVKVDGSTITIDNKGVISAKGSGSSYELPIASTDTLGGVKVDGTTITIDSNGVISSSGGGSGGDTVEPGNGITIADNAETGKKRISVDYGNGLTLGDSWTDESGVIHFPLIPSIDNRTITLNEYHQLTAAGGGMNLVEGNGIVITDVNNTGKSIGVRVSKTNQNGGPGLSTDDKFLRLIPAGNNKFGGVQVDSVNTPLRAGDYGVLSLAVNGGLTNRKVNDSTVLKVDNDPNRGLGLDSNDLGPLYVKADNKTITFDSNGQLQYIMPPATNATLGGIKVGNGLTIDETGLLSANGGGGNVSLIPNNTETITYYVDTTNGSDSNSGLSSDAPLKTLEKALNKHDSINIVINIKGAAEYYFIDGFGYRTITVNFYGADYSTVGGYGTEVYVKDAPITFNVLPQILRGLNSNIYVNSLDGGSAYYNELNLENSILVMPNVSFIQNDNYLRFKQLYMKESYLKIVNQSTTTVNEVSVLLCDIIDSIIEGFKTKLKFQTNYNYTQSIVNSTIKGSYIDVNYGASGISDPNNVKVIFTNGCDFIVIPDITSGYGMKLDNTVLNNCSITTNGWNQDGVDINIVSSYFTNCNLDVFIKDNKLINSKFKNCNISFSYLNGVTGSAWTMNTTIENSTCYVGSITHSNVISGLTLTHCNWIGTELNDNQWTVAGSIVNGTLKT